MKTIFKELKSFLALWLTQSFSALGSSMTGFALVIWAYQKSGSALTTSLLGVSSYAPYILVSIFAGALSDKWNKKVTMLVSDSFAALCTIIVLIMLKADSLEIWHLYIINAFSGLMNSVQQPASDVSVTLLTPKKYYQKVSGMKSFSNSVVSLLTPVLATSVLTIFGLQTVIVFDLVTFIAAFLTLLLFIRIPETNITKDIKETVFSSAESGLRYLKNNRGILDLILFLAAINLIASIYEAALPARIISAKSGGENILGLVNTCAGFAMLAGSVIVSFMPTPKSRVKSIFNALLFSMSTENFLLAFGNTSLAWCIGAVLGWLSIPVLNANMDVIFREKIPVEIQGRVYSVRNTFQFFTIPIGYLLGGVLVDKVFVPLAESLSETSILSSIFGNEKASGAAMLYSIIAVIGVAVCLVFRTDKHIWKLEK